MDKQTKRQLADRIDKWEAVKHLTSDQGFSIFLADFIARRDKHYRSLLQNTEHVYMLKHAGRLEVLDEILSWMDKAESEARDAVKRLNRSIGDNSEEESQ